MPADQATIQATTPAEARSSTRVSTIDDSVSTDATQEPVVVQEPVVGEVPLEDGEQEPTWVDGGHGFMTERMTRFTRWVDTAFGDTEADLDQAESRLRLRLIHDYDQRLGQAFRVRLGGKVELPRLSRKLDLIFEGDEPQTDINGQADPSQSRVGLQYRLGDDDDKRHRFDLNLGLSAGGPRPGARYRYAVDFSPRHQLRFTQRVQWEADEGAFTTSRLFYDYYLDDHQLLRSNTRVVYGQKSEGLEWSSSFAHIVRWRNVQDRERGTMGFVEVSGVTEPRQYVSNYRLGLRYRQQSRRDYLYFEIEPSYNWRIDEPTLPRQGAWAIELRVEFLLIEELRRDRQ
jgi:hypothetical protein